MSIRILVVDDEPQLAELVARHLEREGYRAATADDGVAALTLASGGDFDLAVVDVNMPGMTGFEVCRRLKQIDGSIRVLMLSARDAVDDRVHGLDSGADDYLTKPFEFAELFARLRVLTRRNGSAQLHWRAGDLALSVDRGAITVGEANLQLSRREFDLLKTLVQHAGETVSRPALLAEVWGSEHFESNVVDQYVGYLRRKLDSMGSAAQIVTERGVGFRLLSGGTD
ncbi:two-component system OmpR family response regulator [Microbacterium natoriense]|uniref:Two-component system OmpR family response regulator n=1 Tax=Microbacterium natoriense TaxID=284570 RepID=A0AAW8EZH3_9MICO|nr:response regulator transcription factor [Microbacterium natoriense]MDQ0648200.1 two-component system OmpR family response regulator [Microbacterium natoriense]